ncbi:hypothetical protein F444_19779 [Phytophthora nicotianae P1976]|uniref:Uncharacterized protein n=1 Tax=Phytophthora nicotianae P1976 TaxID=1317066 RepID=A0A080Z6N0_PHYNI|nr:hypothetical protein F444_19779 [Phytophthora nicotianae P1976]
MRSMKLGVHCPRRARRHPSPHSWSLRKRTDSSRTTTVVNFRHNSNPSISAVLTFRVLFTGSRKIGSVLTGGICRKSPTSTTWMSPNGTRGTCLYRRNSLSRRSHSVLVNIETSSITRRSSGAKCLLLIARFKCMRKLASVRPRISVATLPVSAVFTTASSRCQLVQNASTASITRLLPVPPAPPRKSSSWSSVKRTSKLSVQ